MKNYSNSNTRSTTPRKQKCSKENTDPNTNTLKSPLPPRPPSLKRKLVVDTVVATPLESRATTAAPVAAGLSDSGVKVVVRMRPPNKNEEEGEAIVQKISNDTLTIAGHSFTFDSIADPEASQVDIFELVGAPLVENCLAGFNSSAFAYGQTGSGKTYTIWGPANALSDKIPSSDQQGLTPRVFQRLFARIDEEQAKHSDKQLTYQCRCSFLEIYNEQITDLLDPTQKNLQIREDVKTGVYVDDLTEEYVSTMKDVTMLLIKGFSNRRIAATSLNAESSRSHSVFTCVVESRGKRIEDGLSCLKTSRINLVDLAGSERQKLTGAAGDRLKEAGNINRSLSQLGNLINILAEVSNSGKQRHIPYRDSKLTFLLQESLGGNAKLAMICAISPTPSCKSETFSTLRFAQRAKAIKNKAVVNEEMQEDVNVLREVIRQLKDELLRMKANGNQTDENANFSTRWNARKSLNLLKFSLNRSMKLPQTENDSDEEMEIVEESEENMLKRSAFGVFKEENNVKTQRIVHENTLTDARVSIDNDVIMDEVSEQANKDEINVEENTPIKSPTPSVSPKAMSTRKSLKASSSSSSLTDTKMELEAALLSSAKPSNSVCLNSLPTRVNKPTEHLAASLHRGLEIIDTHRKSVALRQSSAFRFSCKLADMKAIVPVSNIDLGVQTSLQDSPVLCSKCKTDIYQDQNMQLVPVTDTFDNQAEEKVLAVTDTFNNQVPKAVEKVLAGAIRREMGLEEICNKQNAEIMQLNRLVQQYKHERECNAIISQARDDKIVRLESLMEGVLQTEEFKDEELLSLVQEHKLLKERYDNHPEVLRVNLELQRVEDELEKYRNFYDLGERDVLVEEIQDLRSYIDSSLKSTKKRTPELLQLTYTSEPSEAPCLTTVPELTEEKVSELTEEKVSELTDEKVPELTEETVKQRIEEERIKWTEAESEWISLVDELRAELKASQNLCQKQKQELEIEKNCSEELKEAMQLAMEGHGRMLEQYVELEEKHIQLLERHRKIQDGIEDVKKAANKAGVRGAESKFINALASEISAIKVAREKEKRHFKDEIKGLQEQLRDTIEAVQAAGELLVRLKEAEEAIASAERRAINAEMEADELKKKYGSESIALKPVYDDTHGKGDEQWKEEFEPFHIGEEDVIPKLGETSSWFSGYDRCNI